MAHWKLLGVVPDSDEEEELDSQCNETIEGEYQDVRPREAQPELAKRDFEGLNKEEKQSGGEIRGLEEPYAAQSEPQILSSPTPLTSFSVEISCALGSPSGEATPQYLLDEPEALDVILEYGEQDYVVNQSKYLGNPNLLLDEEEISPSYVQITSPMSSQLSSPPASQFSLPPNQQVSGQTESPIALNPDGLDEPVLPHGRRFRERKPIQLHPYVVENEKYRRTVKAGGMAPLRLASSQDDRRRNPRSSSPPDQDSYQQDISQYSTVAVDEVEAMDIDWNGFSSSPPPAISHSYTNPRNERMDEEEDDDDDLPNLEQLLRRGDGLFLGKKEKMTKSYSKKHKRHGLPQIQIQSQSTGDIYDVPASPPITSSPYPINTRHFRSPISRLSSVPSTVQTPGYSDHDTSSSHEKPNLPTPATSVLRAELLPLLSDLSSDNDEIMPSGLEAISASSSDEDVAIRKISRKIRGVLPASHLRLNQNNKSRSVMHNRPESLSPVKGVARRGIALPRIYDEKPSHLSPLGILFPSLSDDSGEDDDSGEGGSIGFYEQRAEPQFDIGPSRFGLAEEGDRVDAMLPSRKRRPPSLKNFSHKKQRVGNLATAKRIADEKEYSTTTSKKASSNTNIRNSRQPPSSQRKPKQSRKGDRKESSYPTLGILDLPEIQNRSALPNFIKIAARTVSLKRGKGRQTPSFKFIRLATREDTQDAQSVLNDWRCGRIQRYRESSTLCDTDEQSRPALQQIQHNRQSILPNTVNHTKSSLSRNALVSAMPMRVHIARTHQQSMNQFISKRIETTPHSNAQINTRGAAHVPQKSRMRQSKKSNSVRPAQLESSEFAHSRGYTTNDFRSTKKALDALYRNNRRRPAPQANVQLNRFLEDENVVKQSIESDPFAENLEPAHSYLKLSTKLPREKKRVPQRLDAGAAKYRQPSNPLIMDYLVTTQAPLSNEANIKLTGLGKLGTRYTFHFNVFPLQLGIFFHEDTLIGQERLRKALEEPISTNTDRLRSRSILLVGEQTFTWGEWDESVSSEIGLCFDWIIEQLLPISAGVLTSDDNIILVLSSVLDYVRNHSTCKGPLNLTNFVTRMNEIFIDFSSRFRAGRRDHIQETALHIKILSICMLLILQLLRLARSNVGLSIAWEIELRMKDLAAFLVEILLAVGFDSIYKLYDDLQYLSFREGGIKNDQYVTQAWVILIKTLAAASMSRGSFWELVGPQLLKPVKDVTDTQALERTWYSMFSLLPLCEFDNFGVIKSRRYQTDVFDFDGWRIPQQLIKQVTSVYEVNQKQSPGFNDYCRSLFARCHNLMVHWNWWKCTAVIGSLFDFFASQQLAHLRNEEASVSPRFLAELDTEPSLDLEPEDRCFHIFLKMVALVIKQLANTKDTKTIRNLVARLLPNHNRQFSKNEAIYQRDIASLQNHHDLLSTLYWAAPVDERPSVSQIQDLVVSSQSHNEACLINLRSWGNLARFIVATTTDVASFGAIEQWQISFFSGLCQQYLGQEVEVRQQADSLQQTEGLPMTEKRILETIAVNRRSTMIPMCAAMTAMGSVMNVAKSYVMLKQALNSDVLSMALDPAIHSQPLDSEDLFRVCLRVLDSYIEKVNELCPMHSLELESGTSEGDSQDSQDMAALVVNWERSDLASQLQHNVLDKLSSLLRKYLECSAESTKEPMLIYHSVECWARIVSIVTENTVQGNALLLESFLMTGKYALFENRESFKVANNYWPLFLARLLQTNKSLEDFRLPGFNVCLEWLLSLLKPQNLEGPEQNLSSQLHLKGHSLCSHVELHTSNRIYMIRGTLRKMSRLLIDGTTNTELGISQREAERLFSDMLRNIMSTMQRSLEGLEPLSEKHKDFVEIVQSIVADIKCYASDIVPLIDFFVHPSTFYWPPDTDPTLFEAGIVSYCIRLGAQPGKTSVGLFYYLHNGWQKALTSGSMGNYVNCIRKGMKRRDFSNFMLADFIPAVVGVGFSANGWLLCSTFLPPLSNRVAHLLEIRDTQSEWVFGHLVNLLKVVINGIASQYRSLGGAHPFNRGTIAVAIKFWLSIAAPMRQYVERHPEKSETLSEVADPLTHFIWHAFQSFESSEPEFWHPSGQLDVRKGNFYDQFLSAFERDINDSWVFEDAVGEKVLVRAARSSEQSSLQWFEVSLKEILDREITMYKVLYPSIYERALPLRQSYFIEGYI